MITTLTGSNSFRLRSVLSNASKSFKDRYGDLSIEQIDASESEYQTILDSLMNLPFLSPAKLVVIHSPSSNKQFVDQAEKILADIPSTTEVIIVEPSLDKRSRYNKLLKEITDYQDFSELDTAELSKWILEHAVNKGGKISSKEANHLIDTVGLNQQRIDNELAKLISYNPDITTQNIDLLVEPNPQSTVFQLLDAAFAGNKEAILKIYEDQRQQKVEPQQIIAMLTWQLNNLALIKSAGNLSPREISAETGLSPFVVSKSLNITKRFSFEYIKLLLSQLLELDIDTKTRSIDANDAIVHYLLSINQT